YVSTEYDEKERGFALRLSTKVAPHTSAGITYRRTTSEIEPEEDASDLIKAEAGKKNIRSIKLATIYETLDRPLLPSRGVRNTFSFEIAGGGLLGGDRDFYRTELRPTVYIPVFDRHTLRLRSRVGFIEPFDDSDDIPIFERFFLGGPRTVRGFDYREVGPKDISGEPIGGRSQFLASIEYTVPIAGSLRGAVFYDTGNIWEKEYKIDLSDLRSGAGIGLRIIVPQFPIPINLDYTWPIDKDEFVDPGGRFDFSMGVAF
ncbi:MAG: outer membrane protein assembly factor, partial [Thermoplasmata archaeon]|nr:outer membrane protein assembly factor [Thermoplasmata archaeon]